MMHFYKYMPAETAKIVLNDRTLRWSTASLLNDPFDMQFLFKMGPDRLTVKARALQLLWEHHYAEPLALRPNELGVLIRAFRGMHDPIPRTEFDVEFGQGIDEIFELMIQNRKKNNLMIQNVMRDNKIFCMADRPDNILLWSYYAFNHQGVTLRFTTAPSDNPFTEARAVRYVDTIPSLMSDDEIVHMAAGYLSEELTPSRVWDALIFTKSAHWSHEGEWRICAGSGRDKDAAFEDVPFGIDELDGVIFGARTSEADIAVIRLLVKKFPNAELLQSSLSQDTYALEIHPLS